MAKEDARVGQVVRLAMSAATERSSWSRWLARRTSSRERTLPFDAMVQPGRMRRPGWWPGRRWDEADVAVPEARRVAHSEGNIRSI